jgi:hypothetical protein
LAGHSDELLVELGHAGFVRVPVLQELVEFSTDQQQC